MKQYLTLLLLCACFAAYAKGPKHKHGKDKASYHSFYDDSTMLYHTGYMLMPYNRYIDAAGTVVHFGNQEKECHALDCILLPDGKTLAVEERFGVGIINVQTQQLISYWEYAAQKDFKDFRSTYCGIKVLQRNGATHLYWGAAEGTNTHRSVVIDAVWDGNSLKVADTLNFEPFLGPLALPNDIAINKEDGHDYLYVVLNGNNQLVKLSLDTRQAVWTGNVGMAPYGVAICGSKAYVSNWAGPVPFDTTKETAGIPYGSAYIDHRTGGTLVGSVSVLDLKTGIFNADITVGLHPNAIIAGPDGNTVYVANGNSDNVSVIDTKTNQVIKTIPVRLNNANNPFMGSSPNALAINPAGNTLYVANGMDNAIAVVALTGTPIVKGFIPTQAYPAGLALTADKLFVCNLEGEGARVKQKDNTYNSHYQAATVSIIPLPADNELAALTNRTLAANLQFRATITQLQPRKNIAAKPVPERIGEPSVFKHVIYIRVKIS